MNPPVRIADPDAEDRPGVKEPKRLIACLPLPQFWCRRPRRSGSRREAGALGRLRSRGTSAGSARSRRPSGQSGRRRARAPTGSLRRGVCRPSPSCDLGAGRTRTEARRSAGRQAVCRCRPERSRRSRASAARRLRPRAPRRAGGRLARGSRALVVGRQTDDQAHRVSSPAWPRRCRPTPSSPSSSEPWPTCSSSTAPTPSRLSAYRRAATRIRESAVPGRAARARQEGATRLSGDRRDDRGEDRRVHGDGRPGRARQASRQAPTGLVEVSRTCPASGRRPRGSCGWSWAYQSAEDPPGSRRAGAARRSPGPWAEDPGESARLARQAEKGDRAEDSSRARPARRGRGGRGTAFASGCQCGVRGRQRSAALRDRARPRHHRHRRRSGRVDRPLRRAALGRRGRRARRDEGDRAHTTGFASTCASSRRRATGTSCSTSRGSKAHNVAMREEAVTTRSFHLRVRRQEHRDGRGLHGRDGGGALRVPRLQLDPARAPREPRRAPRGPRGHAAGARRARTTIRGDLHSHTTWSDGRASLDEMASTAAKGSGAPTWRSATTRAASATAGSSSRPRRSRRLGGGTTGLQILRGIEVDIRADGSLDMPDDVLAGLDWVMASGPLRLRRKREELTRRIEAAMENPHVDCIGHPTGRKINRRDPYDVDFEALLEKALETGTFLEINCQPDRLDLTTTMRARPRRPASSSSSRLTRTARTSSRTCGSASRRRGAPGSAPIRS